MKTIKVYRREANFRREASHSAMKKLIILMILAVLILPGSILNAQKEDNVWILGSGNETTPVIKPYGGTNLVFNEWGGADTLYYPRKTDFYWSNASICSPEGNLLFYTNGNYISNRQNWIMRNGDGLGEEHFGTGNALPQNFLILPFPGHKNQYLIIHSNWEIRKVNENWVPIVYNLKYTKVDMDIVNEFGEVIEKNVVISNIEHSFGGLTACRHANGRDWWIIMPGFRGGESSLETYLLDPNGVNYAFTQYFDNGFLGDHKALTNTIFSPNGHHFVLSQTWNLLEPRFITIFNFDRCTGTLSLKETITETEKGFSNYVVFSSNSELLYSIQDSAIFQYEVNVDTVYNTKIEISRYDGFIENVPTFFEYPVLAPNGKIYINTPNNSHYLHVIEKPDVKGQDCEVRQHSIVLPSYNVHAMPNFPHFRLGKLEGSPCDTLITSTRDQWADSRFKLYPNPTSGPISIELDLPEWSRDDVSISLFDVTGKEVYRYRFAQWAYIHTIDPGTLPAGVYLVRLEIDGAVVHTDRVVVN